MASKRVWSQWFNLWCFLSNSERTIDADCFFSIWCQTQHPCKVFFKLSFALFVLLRFRSFGCVCSILLAIMQINNVGKYILKPTLESTAEDFSSLMATNLESAYQISQLAHHLLKASGYGNIVFVSSVTGVVSGTSSIYGATKGS